MNVEKWLLLLIFAAAPAAYAQSCAQADASAARHYGEMEKYGSYSYSEAPDVDMRFEQAVKTFDNTMRTYLHKQDSWKCKFPLAQKAGIRIQTSPDGKLRAFSWDWQTGGTMHHYAGWLQYRDSTGNVRLADAEGRDSQGGGYVVRIFSDTFGKHGQIYGVIRYYRLYNSSAVQSVELLRIDGGKLVPQNIIRTSRLTNRLSYEYNPYSTNEGVSADIDYRPASKTISLPVVRDTEDSNGFPGRVTKHRIRYRFDGQYFIRQK